MNMGHKLGAAIFAKDEIIKELREEIKQLREALAFIRKYADETHDYWDAGSDSTVGKRLLALAGELQGYDHELDKALALTGD